MARRFYPPRAARLSPQPGGHLLSPLRTHTLQLRQGVTMYPSYSNGVDRLTACVLMLISRRLSGVSRIVARSALVHN